jgi:hypothetical protein
MPDVLVNFRPSVPGDTETAEVAAELLAAVRELGYDAGVEDEPIVGRGSGLSWTLILRWVGEDVAHTALGIFLTEFARRVLVIFRSRRRQPPRFLELYGPDGETVISQVQVHDDDEEEQWR